MRTSLPVPVPTIPLGPTGAAEGVIILERRDHQAPTLELALEAFLRSLQGKNRSPATIRAYSIDCTQFIKWVRATTIIVTTVDQVERADVTEFLAHLAEQGASGISRARKLAALREYFRFLADHEVIAKSPTAGVETPKKERNGRTYLRPDEYTRMLSQAGGDPRDYAILQMFLQTGVRVAELCDLRLDDVDTVARVLKVHGKGQVVREIALERKGIQAIKSYLKVRPPEVLDDHLFLNKYGEPLSDRGVRKLVAKYRVGAGITKHATPHSLRHTFASYKAERGVSAFQLQEWLGHANLNTTQIYVHMAKKNGQKAMEATSL